MSLYPLQTQLLTDSCFQELHFIIYPPYVSSCCVPVPFGKFARIATDARRFTFGEDIGIWFENGLLDLAAKQPLSILYYGKFRTRLRGKDEVGTIASLRGRGRGGERRTNTSLAAARSCWVDVDGSAPRSGGIIRPFRVNISPTNRRSSVDSGAP